MRLITAVPQSEKSELRKLLAERGRQSRRALNGFHIRRRIFRIQIPPALERIARPSYGRHKLRLVHQAAARQTVFGARGPDVDQPLSSRNVSPDHPVQGTAIEQVSRSLRRLARDMDEFRLGTLLLQRGHALCLPARQLFQRIHADAEFDEVQHYAWWDFCAKRRRIAPSRT